ncbi:MAG: PRC-barrel domain-containing protein [Alphaproteobacteria bacterium]|nr:PRC-barrel domain-containing protein [Alphaproteobacteria bacterium]
MSNSIKATTALAISILAAPVMAQTAPPQPPALQVPAPQAPMSGGASGTAIAPATMPVASPGPLSASDLMGLDILNGADETVGEIKDVVVTADGRISDVIVGVGGFLGVGERHVALPWEQLRIGRSANDAVVARTGATTEQLKALPAMKRDKSAWVKS